jgi:hypothetical protein
MENFTPSKAYDEILKQAHSEEVDAICVDLWKLKIPLKAQIFLWLCRRDGLIMGDLRHKRMRISTQPCQLCNFDTDNTKHIFSSCVIIDYVWRELCGRAMPV